MRQKKRKCIVSGSFLLFRFLPRVRTNSSLSSISMYIIQWIWIVLRFVSISLPCGPSLFVTGWLISAKLIKPSSNPFSPSWILKKPLLALQAKPSLLCIRKPHKTSDHIYTRNQVGLIPRKLPQPLIRLKFMQVSAATLKAQTTRILLRITTKEWGTIKDQQDRMKNLRIKRKRAFLVVLFLLTSAIIRCNCDFTCSTIIFVDFPLPIRFHIVLISPYLHVERGTPAAFIFIGFSNW